MANPFVGEIRIFPANFAPTGWAFCAGQLLPISQNTALFSLLGTQFGGNGQTTFALPNLQGNAPMGQGSGPGLTARSIGATGGSTSVTLLQSTMPPHTHTVGCDGTHSGTQPSPIGGLWAGGATRRGTTNTYSTSAPNTAMNAAAVTSTGGGQAHNNLQPFLTINFIIALQGVFPSSIMKKTDAVIALRPMGAADEAFLYRVYASTRADELAPLDWDEAQKTAFLRMQFNAQQCYYQQQFPDAAFDVILRNGQPAGRLYVDRRAGALHIIDIALLPEHRRAGVGSKLLRDLLAEADRTNEPVRIHVERFNPALRLYERLGFARIGDTGVYYLMERLPCRGDTSCSAFPGASG